MNKQINKLRQSLKQLFDSNIRNINNSLEEYGTLLSFENLFDI